MGLFNKKGEKDELQQSYKESTEEILSKVNCPHQVFAEGESPEVVNEAYIKALERGRKEGFVPALVKSDETMAEWLGILADESYSKEAILQQEKMDGEALLKEWYSNNMEMYGAEEDWDGEIPEEMLEEMDEEEGDNSLISLNSFSHEGIEETILFEIPVKNPWEVIAWIPMGGWNECPAASEMMEICRYWYEKYGAVPAAFSHDTLEFMLEKPVDDEETAFELAKEHYAFCPDRVDQGTMTGTIKEVADCIQVSKVWYFWWD